MLAIAGQMPWPNWLNIFEETHGYPGGNIGSKVFFSSLKFDFEYFFLENLFFFHSTDNAGHF